MPEEIKIYFDSLENYRDWYTEEYSPPNPGFPFSTLFLNVLTEKSASEIEAEMETRCRYWYDRYKIPVLTLVSFKNDLSPDWPDDRPEETLSGFVSPGESKFKLYWGDVSNRDWPQPSYSNGDLLRVFHDIGSRNSIQTRREAIKKYRPIRYIKWLVILTTIFIPMAWLVFEELYSPKWLALVLLAQGIFKLFYELLISTGFLEQSEKRKRKDERERLENHWIHHCELNPKGFERLKNENFKKDIVNLENENIQKLKDKQKTVDA